MRLQLALDVSDIDEAVDFYSKMFAIEPAKRKPGYANFAIADPPLKLVLFEKAGGGNRLNHLGVEVEHASQVTAAKNRMTDSGLYNTGVRDVTCCFADKTEVWVDGPDGARWEWYLKVADRDGAGADTIGFDTDAEAVAGHCCG